MELATAGLLNRIYSDGHYKPTFRKVNAVELHDNLRVKKTSSLFKTPPF